MRLNIYPQVLPILMQNCCPSFSLSQCEYKVERNREATARITVWRCYGVKRSYTFETSYCGCDEGLYKVNDCIVFYWSLFMTIKCTISIIQGYHFGIKQLKEIGTTFCMSLSSLEEETKKRANLPANNRLSSITTRYVRRTLKSTSANSCLLTWCLMIYYIRFNLLKHKRTILFYTYINKFYKNWNIILLYFSSSSKSMDFVDEEQSDSDWRLATKAKKTILIFN